VFSTYVCILLKDHKLNTTKNIESQVNIPLIDHTITDRFLSDLADGETAYITKVRGYGAFRKRITEMGFVSGTLVKAIKKAPLQDPAEYELMGYQVSLRRSEAELIEILPADSLEHAEKSYNGTHLLETAPHILREQSHHIHVALVGNPNCGKTTLFNYATGKHERVGNYGGVTVDIKTARLKKNDHTLFVTDLPGTYSISEYSPEELFVRHHLTDEMPDVVINVIDASNIERNLYLTTQLIDMDIKVVIALNMFDELENKGDRFDYKMLGEMIGIPIVPCVASKGKGIDDLMQKVIDVYHENEKSVRHVHINYGADINKSIDVLTQLIDKNKLLTDRYHSLYLAIKLLENDSHTFKSLAELPGTTILIGTAKHEQNKLEKAYNEKTETILTDAKYAFIKGALKETYHLAPEQKRKAGHDADSVLTHKWLGFPVFLFFMWAMFQVTFTLGSYPMDWIDIGLGWLSDTIGNTMPQGALHDLIVDGIIGGVGGVIVFLPNILILFFCISLMEDTGYMARAAFIMDRLMHKIGLHGKSFIPLLMGFGCNVPAIMATRTLENRKDRLLTMLIIPFMSCSARLPVYVLLISAFFPVKQGLVLLAIYVIGVVLAIVVALLFKKIFFKKAEVPFVMELPPYRMPTLRNTSIHMWNKSVQYLTKMGTVILFASILIWALGYFPRNTENSMKYDAAILKTQTDPTLVDSIKTLQISKLTIERESERMEKSYIGQIGHFITPIIAPLGFDWKIGVSIVTGLAAKEILVGSMGVLYQSDLEADETSVGLQNKLQKQVFTSGPRTGEKVFSPLVAFTLMLFVLIYFPCIAVIAAVKREANWGWAAFTMIYTTVLAWLVAFATYQVGSLL
jgi:ferrous iron transport protein B